MRVLQLTPHYHPNIGGVETHYLDLVKALVKRNWRVFVLTYQPLTTKVKGKTFEKQFHGKLEVLRLPWPAGFFYQLLSHPALEFFYLAPGLFLVLPVILVRKKFDVIHGHGLVAGSAAVFWGKVFGIRIILSTHSIYNFPERGLYRSFALRLFNSADKTLTLSKQSAKEIESLGVSKERVAVFTYWLNLKRFKIAGSKPQNKKSLGLSDNFFVLFVGRLVPEKGLNELLEASRTWDSNITLVIAGTGPMEEKIKNEKLRMKNLVFAGRVENFKLPLYYRAADLLVVPSVHEEGFGRVILEALACGTPVIGSNRGAIPEAMDETVGRLVDVSSENIKRAVEYFFKNRKELEKLSQKAREFAEKRYSEKNVDVVVEAYAEA